MSDTFLARLGKLGDLFSEKQWLLLKMSAEQAIKIKACKDKAYFEIFFTLKMLNGMALNDLPIYMIIYVFNAIIVDERRLSGGLIDYTIQINQGHIEELEWMLAQLNLETIKDIGINEFSHFF